MTEMLIMFQDLSALIIPGGFAPDYWRRDKRFKDLVTGVYNLGKFYLLSSAQDRQLWKSLCKSVGGR